MKTCLEWLVVCLQEKEKKKKQSCACALIFDAVHNIWIVVQEIKDYLFGSGAKSSKKIRPKSEKAHLH